MTGGVSRVMWEYRVISDTDRVQLSVLGREGWELVTSSVDGAEQWLYFKRPAPGFRERVTLEQRAKYYSALEIAPTVASDLEE